MDRRPPGVRVRGDRIQIDFYYRGVRCREQIPLRPTPSNLREAARKREAVLFAISNGTFEYLGFFPNSTLGKRLFRTASRVTVGELLQWFLRTRANTTECSTIRDYRSAVSHHLVPAFGDMLVSEMKPSHIREWMAGLGISRKRVNNVLVPLRGALQDAIQDGLIASNPAASIANLTIQRHEPDPFTLDEIRAILDACTGAERYLFQFAFWTGLRTSELIGLNWWDVDWKRNLVMVRRAIVRGREKGPKTKSGVREVQLLEPAKEALEALKGDRTLTEGRVFLNPRTGAPWTGDGPIRKTAWQPVLIRAGVKYRYPYQTRHTYASLMLSAGENPMWVAEQMGHRDWGMIRRTYGKWMPSANSDAGRLATRLWSQHGHGGVASG